MTSLKPRRSFRERVREMPRGWKAAFAFCGVAIMLLAIAANVHHESLQNWSKAGPDPHVRTIDLDFFPIEKNVREATYRSGGPLGTLDLGGRADGAIITYWYGRDFVTFEGAS